MVQADPCLRLDPGSLGDLAIQVVLLVQELLVHPNCLQVLADPNFRVFQMDQGIQVDL